MICVRCCADCFCKYCSKVLASWSHQIIPSLRVHEVLHLLHVNLDVGQHYSVAVQLVIGSLLEDLSNGPGDHPNIGGVRIAHSVSLS
jgi:hypothetical protein